ncbi:hypothetical protein BGZ61DRAFT_484468 [Ilyonectria robusta]|uniref:uncharacterized protein n=1 Tax=Ilyonectria robusta TaxID=1079257 RepID=UPI001E8DE2B7|nr:uncharacterized protein BGZ61DRAFT_484468 [Ilyonectria robusta]KAH8665378.1 hypothetical protein BGZ61DRAFT_484468 [Ilyonectria robusta]
MVCGGVPNTTVPLEPSHERIPPMQAHQEFLNDWINIFSTSSSMQAASSRPGMAARWARNPRDGCNKTRAMEVHKYDGKYVTEVDWARSEFEHDIIYAGHRGKLHSIILAHAKSLVPDIRIGVGVTKYLENETQPVVVLSTDMSALVGNVYMWT